MAALVATITALTLQYFRTISVLDAESRHVVGAEINSFVDRYAAGGLPELLRFVDARARHDEIRDYVYIIGNSQFEVIAGDLSQWPQDMKSNGWSSGAIPLENSQGTITRNIDAQIVRLGPDCRLLVGHLATGRVRLRNRFIETLIWSIGLTALIGLGFGWWVSRRALSFVERASDSGEQFLAGHLDVRLPTTGRGDEYDRLAEMVNACFSEVERMLVSLRAATDGLAHDLKTQITRIKARIELAIMRDSLADPVLFMETVQDLDALLKLINDLLGLARTESISVDAFRRVDLASVVIEAVTLYEPVAESEGRSLNVHEEPAIVLGVRPLLMHAVVNLIDNAIKYSGGGSNIQVATETRDGLVILSVADNGIGIAAEDHDRALARLSRLDQSQTKPGSGLGLSIVAAVARAHGGTLTLADNLPGLKVILELPAYLSENTDHDGRSAGTIT